MGKHDAKEAQRERDAQRSALAPSTVGAQGDQQKKDIKPKSWQVYQYG